MCSDTSAIPAAVRSLCEHTHFEHRIFTRFINPGAGSPFVDILGWTALQDEQETALVPEIAHLPTLVVNKFTYSPFVGTRLEETLANFGIRDIAVCGIDTDACVLATVIGLMDRGIRPTVLSDLTGSTGGSEVHHAALRVLTRVVGPEKILRRSG